MSLTLIDSLKNSLASRRQVAVEKYRTIIFRYESPEAGDLAELSTVMEELKITPAMVEADAAAMNQVRRLEADQLTDDERHTISVRAGEDREKLLAKGRDELAERILSVDLDRVPDLASQIAILTSAMPEKDPAVIACAEASHVLHLSDIKIRKAEDADEKLAELAQLHPFLFTTADESPTAEPVELETNDEVDIDDDAL